jgi:hypothetical protein
VRVRSSPTWEVDTGGERLAVSLVELGGVRLARVVVSPRGAAQTPVSDARCLEVLRPMRGVAEFVECEPAPGDPLARVWLGMLPSSRLPFELPAVPGAPAAKDLPAQLVAARKHLPDKLPDGWSVPVAVTPDGAPSDRQGVWAMGVDGDLVMACLCASEGRTRLMVGIARDDGTRASESAAVEVLRHFRGVVEFRESTSPSDEPNVVFYLGELRPSQGENVALN